MDEARLRELATELRGELPEVIPDERARDRTAAALDTALALPPGEATKALRVALAARQETRDWMLERLVEDPGGREDERDRFGADRTVVGLPGTTSGSGLHFVCPQGNYDIYVERITDSPGRCPIDRSKLVRVDH